MNRIKQRIPNYVDIRGLEVQESDFVTVEDLKAVPFVAHWITRPEFARLSKSDTFLLVEFMDSMWRVIGYLQHPEDVELPTFIHPRDRKFSLVDKIKRLFVK